MSENNKVVHDRPCTKWTSKRGNNMLVKVNSFLQKCLGWKEEIKSNIYSLEEESGKLWKVRKNFMNQIQNVDFGSCLNRVICS